MLVGSLVPEGYGAALAQVSSTLSELATLHRETERQQRELTRRAEELQRLNRDLEESNRGVRSLHAALDEKAENLQRASDVKSREVAIARIRDALSKAGLGSRTKDRRASAITWSSR